MNASTRTPGSAVNRRIFLLGGAGATALLPQVIPASARAADAPAADATERLAGQTQRNLRWAGPPPANWVRRRENVDHNVVIVGGGQTGLGIAHGLRRKGIGNVDIIDRAEPGQAGIWRNVARMHNLRTPKLLPGPEQGNPELGFRAWFETLNGGGAFDALQRIPRLAWADYLAWFEQVTEANTRYRTRLLDVEPVGDILRLHLEVDGARRTETTRKLVFANGFAGAGGANLPGFMNALPAKVWSHTEKPFDYAPLAAKVVGVIGAGASAFDAAASALESGAKEVHLYSRRTYIDYPAPVPAAAVRLPLPDRGHPNIIELGCELPDGIRWRDHLWFEHRVATVPPDSIERVMRFDNFHIHLGSEWTDVAMSHNGKVTAKIAGRTRRFDHVVAATGYRVDLAAQPELARIEPNIALWRDRFQPPAGEEDRAAANYPYLGAGMEFLPRAAAGAEYLRNIHCFNLAASASFGILVGDIPSMALQPRLVAAIARDLFAESVDEAASARFLHTPPVAPDPAPYQKAVSAA